MTINTHLSNTADTVLWVYIVLLFAGGMVGFLKAKSKASLIMSTAFAAVLILCQLRMIPVSHLADIVLIFLLIFFTVRFSKSRKFMPNGLMSIITFIALILRHIHI